MTTARTRILDVAEELFGTKGFASTSVREIVDEAGVKAPALYYHFGSKDGLLEALLQDRQDNLFVPLAEKLEEAETVEQFFQTHSRFMLHMVQARPATLRFMLGLFTAPRKAVPMEKVFAKRVAKLERMMRKLHAVSGEPMNRIMFAFQMHEGMTMNACLQFLSGWAMELPEDLADAIALRSTNILSDGLPVPAGPNCTKMREKFGHLMPHLGQCGGADFEALCVASPSLDESLPESVGDPDSRTT